MADAKISAFGPLLNTEIAPTDIMPIVDISAGAAGSKQVSIDVLFQSILSRVTNGVVTKTGASVVPAADEVVLLCDCTSAVMTVVVPNASTVPKKMYFIKKIDVTSNIMAVTQADASPTGIDGTFAVFLRAVNHGVVIVADAPANIWRVVAAVGGGGGWEIVTYAATVTPNARRGWDFEYAITLTGPLTLNGPINPADGQIVTFRLKQDTTGGRILTLAGGAGNFVVPSDVTPTLSTAGNTTDILTAVFIALSNRWLVLSLTKGAIGI